VSVVGSASPLKRRGTLVSSDGSPSPSLVHENNGSEKSKKMRKSNTSSSVMKLVPVQHE